MFARSLEDIGEDVKLTFGQEQLAEALKDAGHTVGFWFYDNEWAAAKHESADGDIDFYWEITTDASLDEIRKLCSEVKRDTPSCGHYYDCCGCSFLSSFWAATKYNGNLFDEVTEATYIICESWGLNI